MNPQQSTRLHGSMSHGGLSIYVYEDRIEIKRWYTVDGEPGDLGDRLALKREDAATLGMMLEKLVGEST